MKKIILVASITFSLISCANKTNYTLRSLENVDHNKTTVVNKSAQWSREEVVYINGHAWQVMWVNY